MISDERAESIESRVLILAPTARDAALSRSLFAEVKIPSAVVDSMSLLCSEIERGAAALLLTEDALQTEKIAQLTALLSCQPPWSDLPILVLTSGSRQSVHSAEALSGLGNITLLERPVRIAMLVSAARTAIRARQRQYLIREYVAEQERTRELLRDRERLYRAIGESIAYGIWICDRRGHNVYASQSFLDLLGLSQEQYSTVRWEDILHPDDVEPTRAAWRECLHTCRPWDMEQRYRSVSGEWRPILSRGVPVRDDRGEVFTWVGLNLDISRQKAAEDALRDASRRKDEFLAMLAHELRNPLAAVMTAAAVLQQAPLAEPSLRRAREVINRQSSQMSRLLEDLLDVSRITQGVITLRRTPLDLRDLVTAALETCRVAIEERSHQLVIDLPAEPTPVIADPARVEQIFTNLLGNAAKYTPPGGTISVSLKTSGDSAILCVRDTGIGIAPSLLPHIFDLFTQGDRDLDRSQGGLGIGLTLVRTLVHMHGGSVVAQSDGHGRGSAFSVTLPMIPTAALEASDHPDGLSFHRDRRRPGRRILVVDDNNEAAEVLAELVSLWGHEVRVANNGPEALRLVPDYHPDIVLLDIGMPGMDGFEVAQQIRAAHTAASLRLIALTGYGRDEDRIRSRQAGFDYHLTKPVEPGDLAILLESPKE